MTATVGGPVRRLAFHPLTVTAVDVLTEDSVAVTFAVPAKLRAAYDFSPGQHVTVRRGGDGEPTGEQVRRSYSICSTPSDLLERGVLRIGVRAVAEGAFSQFARTRLRAGDVVDVLTPLGRFTTTLDPARSRHYAAIAAGAGITPVLSLVAATLSTEPASRFTVLYGNRQVSSVMFLEELAGLKDRTPQRLHLIYVFSREPASVPLLSGRLDAARLSAILDAGLFDVASVDEWFICGPHGMVTDARAVLTGHGVPESAVRVELFRSDEASPASTRPARPPVGGEPALAAIMTVRLAGRESTVTVRTGERVLDAALRERPELPYACQGGVCGTCRARLLLGEVTMAYNYALEPDEVAAGYVLTCQSTPAAPRLIVDYDA